MKIEDEYALSFYREIDSAPGHENVCLVRHVETGQIYLKKTLPRYERRVFDFIHNSHPAGVPRIVELVEDDGILTVIEEYISGETLRDVLARDTIYTPEQSVTLGLRLCELLEPFHRQIPPIVHRDIKPENILISSDGQLKLLDFDAAKVLKPDQSRDTVLIGTAGYAAPEQYGFGPSSPATDIFAIGKVMQECLGVPCQGSIPAALSQILQVCTAMEPTARYQSVTALREALLAALAAIRLSSPSWPREASSVMPAQASKTAPTSAKRAYHPYALPGFRTRTPWKMLVAILGYPFLIWFGYDCYHHFEPFSHRVALMTIFFLFAMAAILLLADYGGIRKRLPLCRNKNHALSVLGVILWLGVCAFLALMVGGILQSILEDFLG